MIPVAIVLLVLLLLFTAGAIVSNADPVVLNVFVAQIPTNLAVVFIIGMATALAFVAALALLGLGVRRQRATTKGPRTAFTADKPAKSTKAKESKPPKDKALQDRDAKPLQDDAKPIQDRDRGPA